MTNPERDRLLPAFDRVAPANWKAAIDAVVELPAPAVDADAFCREWNLIREAIAFFTGSAADGEIIAKGASTWSVRFTAPGYYAAIGS